MYRCCVVIVIEPCCFVGVSRSNELEDKPASCFGPPNQEKERDVASSNEPEDQNIISSRTESEKKKERSLTSCDQMDRAKKRERLLLSQVHSSAPVVRLAFETYRRGEDVSRASIRRRPLSDLLSKLTNEEKVSHELLFVGTRCRSRFRSSLTRRCLTIFHLSAPVVGVAFEAHEEADR